MMEVMLIGLKVHCVAPHVFASLTRGLNVVVYSPHHIQNLEAVYKEYVWSYNSHIVYYSCQDSDCI